MNPGVKRLPAHFYRRDSGTEPVREWLKELGPEDRKVIGEDIKDVEFSWPIGMRGRIARILFCVEQSSMVLLHGFIKKTHKTPQREIDLALKRKKGGSA